MADRPYPKAPDPFAIWRDPDDDCGAWRSADKPVFTLAQVHAMIDADRRAAPAPAGEVIDMCRKALAEELSAWDLDPPLHHVKEAHDACVAYLAAIADAERAKP